MSKWTKPSLPDDLAEFPAAIKHVRSTKFKPNTLSEMLTTMCAVDPLVNDRVARTVKKKTTDTGESKVLDYYLPPLPEGHLSKPLSSEKWTPRNTKEKNDKVDKKQSSYRKLRTQFDLESDPLNHFTLNHKYKITPFGRPSAVDQDISDDEGAPTTKNLNSLYQTNKLNDKYNQIADDDILSQISLDDIESMDDPEIHAVIRNRCRFHDTVRYQMDICHQFQRFIEIEFSVKEPTFSVDYVDFLVITTLLANVEKQTKSLSIGSVINDMLESYRSLISVALKKSKNKFDFVCDSLGVKFVNVTHQLVRSLSLALKQPNNWKYQLYVNFLVRKKIDLSEIMEELESELAKHIEAGLSFCRDILQYRELLCALDLNSYIELMDDEQDLLGKDGDTEKSVINMARAYLNYGKLYGVKFCFTKDAKFSICVSDITDRQLALPVFPVMNMFDLNADYLRKDEAKHLFRYIPF